MTGRLAALVEKARLAKSSPGELAAHLIDFAYGNAACEDGRVTREGFAIHPAEDDLTV